MGHHQVQLPKSHLVPSSDRPHCKTIWFLFLFLACRPLWATFKILQFCQAVPSPTLTPEKSLPKVTFSKKLLIAGAVDKTICRASGDLPSCVWPCCDALQPRSYRAGPFPAPFGFFRLSDTAGDDWTKQKTGNTSLACCRTQFTAVSDAK